MNYNITDLEIPNIVVALKVWVKDWTNKCIKVRCVNMAVDELLCNGKARDNTLALLARNMWLICGIFTTHNSTSHTT